jgi:hypothetical protein
MSALGRRSVFLVLHLGTCYDGRGACYAKCRIARDLVHIDVTLLHRQFKRSPSLQKKKAAQVAAFCVTQFQLLTHPMRSPAQRDKSDEGQTSNQHPICRRLGDRILDHLAIETSG